MIALFKISNLIMLRGRKSQFVIMPLYGPTKLLDASKAVSKMAHIKISYKQHARLSTPGL